MDEVPAYTTVFTISSAYNLITNKMVNSTQVKEEIKSKIYYYFCIHS